MIHSYDLCWVFFFFLPQPACLILTSVNGFHFQIYFQHSPLELARTCCMNPADGERQQQGKL